MGNGANPVDLLSFSHGDEPLSFPQGICVCWLLLRNTGSPGLSTEHGPLISPQLISPQLISPQNCHPERRRSRSRRTCRSFAFTLLLVPFLLGTHLSAQTLALTAPPSAAPAPTPPTISSPNPTHTFHDPAYLLSFDYPANWTFAHADHEISTFHLDARSAVRRTLMRAVVAMPENPFPASTFSGAYVYFSVTPRTSAASCAKQAAIQPEAKPAPSTKPVPIHIADIPFTHGHDEQREICIVQRDEIYTTRHRGSCYRFDLAINNFCGGEVSGVKDITPGELDQVRARLTSIVNTLRFDPK